MMIRLKPLLLLFVLFILLEACSSNTVETGDNFEMVELPDGSVVFLNHHSEVSYDKDFETRTLEVAGEVFLDVVKAEGSFVVKTAHGDVTVLGTEFNVKTSAEELEVEVEEGVVEVKNSKGYQKVKKGQRATWKKGEQTIKKGKAEMKFKVWLSALEREFKKLGKEIKRGSKHVQKESKEVGKEFHKGAKKLKKELKSL
ncbi:FecR domain-containing protein [Fulvivirga sp. 29W222]|uniref:FecR domain-containing protein n=1 Tax=Fulvivirga marina TaxID=2494733 RepID=A0A937FX03_9BACT|nr:FecR domain-containing protein [Fulvivirga marina]MBL6447715.1 FecR domain-containing protein [Fulvivirga marina]